MSTHFFGIRHHGPGSARSLLDALYELVPDIILVEGPPDADDLIPLFGHEDMVAPIAMLVYVPDEPQYAAYYPFAEFSPEFQALRFALENDIPARFMDLPLKYAMRIKKDAREALEKPEADELAENTEDITPDEQLRSDPLGELAKAAGYADGERWWEHFIENRDNDTDVFTAILEAMTALRDEGIVSNHPLEDKREAYMRRIIRQAEKDGYQRIAVVCGAWHTPALANMPTKKHDAEILKGMKRIKIDSTFTPWTHSRLTMRSGYGAGIWSPGWYQHRWQSDTDDLSISWMTKVAQLLRTEDLDASPAQVIDAVRLADTLAAIRERSMPSLEEFNEAALSVFCFGNPAPLNIIHDKLIVGETMGEIPDETPMMPLQRDLKREQKRLRLKVNNEPSDLKLDLREESSRERSYLLHRLSILDIGWGSKQEASSNQGTFTELWQLAWRPELTIQIIEKSTWGNTVFDATSKYSKHVAKSAKSLPELTELVNDVLLANLPDAVPYVVHRLQAEAAATGDIKELMHALPELADVMTYGNVREMDADMISTVVEGIVTRTCIGLPHECSMLDDEAATAIFEAMLAFNSAIYLLDKDEYSENWHRVLKVLMAQDNAHGMIRGRACRILLNDAVINREEARRQMQLAISLVSEPSDVASWIEGFLKDSGLILVHDEDLLGIIDDWVMSLEDDNFENLLPLLRRTVSTFEDPERRQIGRIISGRSKSREKEAQAIDKERAEAILPMLSELLGLNPPSSQE
ncbi:MAG: DUF5682 family protein [Phototrophicaceae bacterium]